MTQINELAGEFFARVATPAQGTAATAEAYAVLRAEDDIVVTAVRWIPNAAVTGAATNNFALGLVNRGLAGSGTTAVSPVRTYASGTNAAAFVPEDLTVTPANTNVVAGETLSLNRTVNGTGLVSPGGVVEIAYRLR